MLKTFAKKFRFSCFTKECIIYDGKCPLFGVIDCPKDILNNLYNRIKPAADIKPMGRWKTETEFNKAITKADNANEDHCGPCGNKLLINIHKVRSFKVPE